ncbi:MAG: tRNA (N6-isopentenyl adenosine(37)-C2)-methylthiotransferase MiaB [Proteobacteria bacterium]|nr:tRNA (N6-isopentenyl adenosine(37)-C2)-methylthiotransferase MiaB [Pseudomonadota bacterium]
MKEKKVYIYTIGCQMNVYDSEQIENLLQPVNYSKTDSLEHADLIIVNTCSIRAKAEEKAFSFLGRASQIKNKNHQLIIGIGGCVAQQEGEKIFKRVPQVDIVFGTRAIGRLPKHVTEIEKNRERIVDIDMSVSLEDDLYPITDYQTGTDISKFVTIMRGCDNFCTYCVVPYVRGRETSRVPEAIISEIENLVSNGIKEVTLLGQNVNSYGKKEGWCSFPDLLSKVNDIDGLKRIRFATSHPKDLSDELIQAIASLDKLVKHIHLPVQSGSDRILKKMNRHYTKEIYIDKVNRLKKAVPNVEITTDMIVGFPGESKDDFEETIHLMKTVQFDGLFAFKYSDRPDAPAESFMPKVYEAEKKDRLKIILDLQETITRSKHQEEIGKIKEILVEGYSKHSETKSTEPSTGKKVQWTGRTSGITIVNFIDDSKPGQENEKLTGQMVKIKIEKAFSHSLWGKKNTNGYTI